ncbi:protease complex subunit PrcB family protein [Blautia schinkii]|nr:protease complex subunit PrcB family protein [Blautia schinkii]
MKKTVSLLCLAAVLMTILSGCRIVHMEEKEKTPLDYTVVKQEDIPKEVAALIENKKAKEFQMTYQSENFLYLIKGYGQQMSGGYSIQVEELALSDSAVFFKTKLLGPSDSNQGGEPSYPYIVIKMQYREEPVQFQ